MSSTSGPSADGRAVRSTPAQSAARSKGSSESPPKNAGEMVARGRAWFEAQGRADARLEAELLVAHALGLDRLRLFLELERPITPDEVRSARELFVRRARGEPVAYLVGQREFYGRSFGVGPEVLVPRPETELLVDLARARLDPERTRAAGCFEDRSIAELGTGSGCLAITLALELVGARVVASDVSEPALERARRNAAALEANIDWRLGDGFGVLAEAAGEGFDLLVSNPPYVRPEDPELDADVRAHEPALALFAPDGDPDHWVRRLLDEGLPLLRPGAALLVELGSDQADRVRALTAERGLAATIEDDLAGLARVLVVESPRTLT